MMDRAEKLRRFFARYVATRAGVVGSAVEEAFAAVPREAFLGPAPWYLPVFPRPGSPEKLGYLATPDDDPAFVYHDGLIALDHERGVHNGEPTLHAVCIDALGIRAGQSVLHVGAGTGYYTAILAHLTRAEGRVFAYEIEAGMAALAKENLARYAWVSVDGVSGNSGGLPDVDAVYVSAGTTQPETAWLLALRPGGKLLFPLQPKGGFGGMLLLGKPARTGAWTARFVSRAGFIACEDALQNKVAGTRLKAAFDGGRWTDVKSFRLSNEPDDTCWFSGEGWWLSWEEAKSA